MLNGSQAVALLLFGTGGRGNEERPTALPKGVINWSHATDHQQNKEQKLQLPKPSISYIRIKREATPDSLWLGGDLQVHPNLSLIACIYSFVQSSSKEGRNNVGGPVKRTGWWGLLHGLRPQGGQSSLAASGSQPSFENETEVMAIANKPA